MENLMWSKTLLKSFNRLDQVAEILDRLVLEKGIASQYSFDSTERLAGKILAVIERKKILVTLKSLTMECLSKLKSKHSKLLILKFFDCMKSTDIATVLGCSMRSLFRNTNQALINFNKNLIELGYDDAKLRLLVKNEPFIKTVYNEVLKEENIAPFITSTESYVYVTK